MITFFRNNLANIITLGNLFSGTVGVIHLINNDYQTTALCLLLSMILDFFDGFIARVLKSSSTLGGELDSLADMVSFGVIPGLTIYKMLEPYGNNLGTITLPFDIAYLGILITLFSCLRLAIFNIDDEQTYSFKGLNTPANTILIFGMFYAIQQNESNLQFLNNPFLLLLITILSSWLLVSPIKMIALKFKSLKLKDNYPKMVLLIGAIPLVSILGIIGIPLIIFYYIIISLLFQKQL